jgi:hypothetical protein
MWDDVARVLGTRDVYVKYGLVIAADELSVGVVLEPELLPTFAHVPSATRGRVQVRGIVEVAVNPARFCSTATAGPCAYVLRATDEDHVLDLLLRGLISRDLYKASNIHSGA